MKILILGYYYRNNFGDDIFAHIFQNYLTKYWPNVDFIIQNTDDIIIIPNDISMIICGGGDIINNYFLQKINSLIINKNIPIYAISVGFPYPQLINQGALDSFDFIIHRNQSDHQLVLNKYGSNRVQYFPDLAFLLPQFSSSVITNPFFDDIAHTNTKFKKIGVFLSKTIYNRDNPQTYYKIIDNLAYFIVKLAQTKKNSVFPSVLQSSNNNNNKLIYQIYLLSCCTNNNPFEDDRLINQDLMTIINTYGSFSNIHIINQPIPVNEAIPIFKEFYFTICTRFHAHILSMIAKVPFMSIYSSRKVKNLITSSNLSQYGIEMDVDPVSLIPIKLDCWPLFEKYNLLIDNYSNYRNTLNILSDNFKTDINNFTVYFDNLLFSSIRYINNPIFVDTQVTTITNLIASKIVNYFGNYLTPADKNFFISQLTSKNKINFMNIYQFISLTNISPINNIESDINLKHFITELIIFFITGTRHTEFNYGLEQQIFTSTYHLFESVKWILQTYNTNINYNVILTNPVKIKLRKFNMKFFKQHDLKGFHRSGWEYVVNHLELFHNPSGPIFDSFLDKTFGWNYDFYKHIDILPFTKSWTGIFHHTPNEDFSTNNLIDVFNKPLFIQSLPYCQGIYVLSNYLKTWITNKLIDLNYPDIKINVLTHPTEFVPNLFTFNKFLSNPNKRVIQVGAWLRNTYAIFQLSTPKEIKKAALKGKNMDNYYIKPHHLNNIKDVLYNVGCCNMDSPPPYGVCRPHNCNSNCNKYIVGLIDMIDTFDKSVEIIPSLSNDDYDQLLSENIIFINLVDASAVNTLIECIVRNTPILINRLPAVIEYLGPDYPLYYDSLIHANQILNDFNLLKKGYSYLLKLNKDKFDIDHLLETFINSPIFRSNDL